MKHILIFALILLPLSNRLAAENPASGGSSVAGINVPGTTDYPDAALRFMDALTFPSEQRLASA